MEYQRRDIGKVRSFVTDDIDLSIRDASKLLVLLAAVDRDYTRISKTQTQRNWRSRNKLAVAKAKDELRRYIS